MNGKIAKAIIKATAPLAFRQKRQVQRPGLFITHRRLLGIPITPYAWQNDLNVSRSHRGQLGNQMKFSNILYYLCE
jgi:hypothetical protein